MILLFYLLILVMPLAEDATWTGRVGGVTVVKLVGIACFLYALYYLSRRRLAPRVFHTWQARCFVAFFLVALVSYILKGPRLSWYNNPLITYTSFLFLLVTTVILIDSLRRLRWALLAAMGGIAYASTLMLREWRWYGYSNMFRPSLGVGNPNDFAAMADLCLPLLFYLLLEDRPRWERLFYLGCLGLSIGGITVAASRGGFLGLAAGLLFILAHAKKRLRNLVVLTIVLIPMFLLPVSPLHRLLHPNRGDQDSSQERIALWDVGIHGFLDNPIIGIGVGRFGTLVAASNVANAKGNQMAHNTYVQIAAEMGLPGIVSFLGMVLASYWTLDRVRHRARRFGPTLLHQASLGMQAGLISASIAIFFSSLEYIKLFWFVVFLTVPMRELAAQARRQQIKRAEQQDRQESLELPDVPLPNEHASRLVH